MPSTPIQNLITVLAVLLELGILAIAIKQRQLRRWPFLMLYLLAELFAQIFLSGVRAHMPWTYFYGYYIWTGLAGLLRILVFIDIAKSFPGASFIGINVPLFIASVAGTIAVLTAWLSCQSGTIFSGDHSLVLMHVLTLADRAFSIAGIAFLAIVLVAIRLLGLGWSRRGIWVCHGLAWTICASIGATLIASYTTRNTRLVSYELGGLFAILGLATWCRSMLLPDEVYEMPREAESLLSVLCSSSAEKVR